MAKKSAIGDLKAQLHTIFFWEINTNYAKKKRGGGVEYTICIRFSKKKIGETPNPRPYCEKIKNSLLGFIWSSKAEVLLLPHPYIRALKAKLHTILEEKSTRIICKKWAHDAPFASNFQKCSRGRPRAPTCRRGIHSRTFSQAALHADLSPKQWTLWIRHRSKLDSQSRIGVI